jgi:hypothetical protein
MGISRRVFHLAEALPNCGKHKTLLAPDAGFDPKAHLLQLASYSHVGSAFAAVDEDSDGGAGAKELRYFGESGLDRLKGIVTRDQADGVPSWGPTGRGGGYPDEAALSQRQMELHATAAGNDHAMQAGQAREADHGIDDLLPVRNGVKLNHLALLEGCLFRLSRGAPYDSSGGGQLAIHVQFDFARQFDDCFGMLAVFEQRIFEGLRAADEQAAIEAVLFLGDPVAAPVLADEDDRGRGTARWRFDELHVGIPSIGE